MLSNSARMTWDGKVYKRSQFGDDRNIKGTAGGSVAFLME
jgi:hypothetical protein